MPDIVKMRGNFRDLLSLLTAGAFKVLQEVCLESIISSMQVYAVPVQR